MKILFATIVCFSLGALVAVAGGDSTTKIEGSWSATAGSDDGKKIPPEAIDKLMMVVVFKDGNYTVSIMGKEVEKGTYKMNATKKPATIDMNVQEGKDKNKTQIGIFKVDADQLTMAVVIGSKNRPKTFDPAVGVEVRELKRNK